jgi:VWFA-related protein
MKYSVPILLLFLVVGVVSAQEPTIRTESNAVLVPALVRDENGHAVYGLQAKDFVIEDDGAAQSATLDEASDAEPISLVIALQRGGRANYEFPRMRGLSTMLDPVLSGGGAEVALVEFDSGVDLIQDFTRNPGLIEKNLNQIDAGDDGAAILDAVFLSEKLLSDRPKENQKMLLLISETRDHGSIAQLDQVISRVGINNIALYALAFSPGVSNLLDTLRGNNIDEMHATPDFLAFLGLAREALRKNVPKTVASMSGGEYALFETRDGFENYMNDFDNHLRSRYLLSFQPKNPHSGLHKIEVHLKDPGKRKVSARATYWAGSEQE